MVEHARRCRVLVTVSLVLFVLAAEIPAAGASLPASSPDVSLRINGEVANESPAFWAVAMDGTTNPANHAVADLLNATPIAALRYGADWADQENWSNGCLYPGTSSCQSLQNNPTGFATLCKWLPSDQCVLGVPGEINSPSTAVYLAGWLKAKTSWTPTCWAVGNEPDQWSHYGIPWTSWASTDAVTPTSAQFASTSLSYTDALRHAFPGACVVGIEFDGKVPAMGSYIGAVTASVSNVSAVAFHAKPNQACTGETLAQMLAPAELTTLATDYLRYARPNASGHPVDVHEFGIGIAPCQPYMGTETDASFVAASIAQALAVGMPQVAFFRFDCVGYDCMVNSSTGAKSPDYTLYSGLFTHLAIAHIYNVSLTGANAETWAVVGRNNASDSSLLVANAAPTSWENVSLAGFVPTAWRGAVYLQSTDGAVTQPAYSSGETVTLPPQSVVVVRAWNSSNASAGPAAGGGLFFGGGSGCGLLCTPATVVGPLGIFLLVGIALSARGRPHRSGTTGGGHRRAARRPRPRRSASPRRRRGYTRRG